MPKKVLAVIEDLFFTVKINEAAKHAGLTAEFVKSEVDALDRAKAQPSVIVIDLNCVSIDPLRLIGDLKSSPDLKGISVLAFVSHVQADLKQKAQEAGCDMVLARSAFSQNMQQIFKRYAGM
jgi:CheY-like chemotaxis protein